MEWLGYSSSRMVKRYNHLHDLAAQEKLQRVDFGAGVSISGDSPVLDERGAAAEQA